VDLQAPYEIVMEEAAQENLKSQEVMKKKKGKSIWLPKVGDYMMVNRPPELVSSKLEPLSDGPFKVLEESIQGRRLVLNPGA
jgi:hypothetical protein